MTAAESKVDVLVIGAGNAGRAAAGVAREAGCSVAVVEEDVVGGTCPNRGCVPKKVLVAACELVDHARRARGHGVRGDLRIDWAELQAHRASIVGPIHGEMEASLASKGIELVRGRARFVGRHVVEVAPGERRIEARKIVVATGSAPSKLPFPGADLLATSDAILELPRVPKTAVFVGAGVVAMELAHVLVRSGCERVVLLQRGDRALPRADEDIVAAFVDYSETLGIEVRTGVAVRAVEREGEAFAVAFEVAGEAERLVVDAVFHGAGRAPRIDGLDLATTGIAVDARGRVSLRPDLRVDGDLDMVFVGDAVPGMPQLSPLASSLGALGATNLVRERHDEPDLRYVPRCVYTIPALAQVGLTEEEARAQGIDVDVKRTSAIPSWISGRTHHEAVAATKVLVSRAGDVVGAHLLRAGAEETIHLFAMAMRHGVSAKALGAEEAAYPTFASDVGYLV